MESYYVLEPDVPKDSSTEITCILRALDQVKDILDRRGVQMPEHLVIEVHLLPKRYVVVFVVITFWIQIVIRITMR